MGQENVGFPEGAVDAFDMRFSSRERQNDLCKFEAEIKASHVNSSKDPLSECSTPRLLRGGGDDSVTPAVFLLDATSSDGLCCEEAGPEASSRRFPASRRRLGG